MMLRKVYSLLLCLTLMLGMSIPASAAAGQKITVDPINIMVGGKEFLPTDANGDNVPVFAYNGTTYAPLRALAEAYGLSVGYNAERKLATVDGTPSGDFAGTKGTKQVLTKRTVLTVMPINIEVGGAVFEPKDAAGKPVSVFAYNGTTYAPLRALAEAYGLTVGYDSAKQLATVTFEKTTTAATVLSAEKDAALQADLQARIDEILNTETEIVHSDTYIPGETYTGTAYYVSNDGDDNNDGLTPETAWQTLDKVARASGAWDAAGILQAGDAVFFRRGDIYRIDSEHGFSIGTDGITLSAYGDGSKPIITGSSENGSGAEKWELVFDDFSGRKIWKYYRDMRDVSMIVLNDGEAITTRVYEYYDGNDYISCEANGWYQHEDVGMTLMEALLPLEEAMTENLSIISRPTRSDPDGGYGECGIGPLYLRCDEGNPGELYSSIEFSEYYLLGNVWLDACNTVFDNLNFQCNGTAFFKCGRSCKEIIGTQIQNCEFAYGGGSVTNYIATESGLTIVGVMGDGIYNIVRNTTIENNYFHNSKLPAVTYEGDNFDDKDTVDGYYHFRNNVCVNTMGLRLDSTAVALQHLDSVIIRGNQIWNTGHMDSSKFTYSEGSIVLWPNHYGECIIEDNIIWGTENGYESNALLNVWFYEDHGNTVPKIRNNTYVQYGDRLFGYFSMLDERNIYMDDPELLTQAAELLGDTTSEFYVIK